MKLAVTAVLCTALSASPSLARAADATEAKPGKGTWIVTEVGASIWNASWSASNADTGRFGRGGIDGAGVRVRTGILFGVAPGFALGPMAGGDMAFTRASTELCCGKVSRVDTARVGVEGAWWPDPNVGFHVHAGFGLAAAATRPDDAGRKNPGVLGAAYPSGSYFTAAIARDVRIGPRTRIGGVLRLEADFLAGDDGPAAYRMHTFLPSLSLVVLTQ
ncbi:MAG: hypothetical protein HYV09_00985 [Deltaproteobacteria bacterium]|nr:hypothetical protein [Deltaproteobacteria bacterium]